MFVLLEVIVIVAVVVVAREVVVVAIVIPLKNTGADNKRQEATQHKCIILSIELNWIELKSV